MDVSILGPLALEAGDTPVTVRGNRRRSLLARLAVADGRTVRTDELLEDVWPGGPPPAAGANLQTYVHQLRRLLGADGSCLVTRQGGYALELAPDGLDARRFEQLVERARGLDTPGERSSGLADALGLWRGPALVDFADHDWARAHAARLEALRLVALEERMDARLACGGHAEALPELESLVAEHPLRERFWSQLMLALYRCGRQADALRAYRRLRERLVDELGIEPSPEVTRLEQAMLEHDPKLVWAPAPVTTTALPTGVVTFLLTDVEGSTALWENDAAAMERALAHHDDVLGAVIAEHGGVLLKERGEGDSVFAVFTRASAAAAAALEAQDRMSAPEPGELHLSVRMGLHTGEAVERDGDYFGPTVNRAARLRSLAGGGEVVVSQATAELVRGRLPDAELVDLGQRVLRGVHTPERVYALRHGSLRTEARPTVAPALIAREEPADGESAPFVGRTAELARMRRLRGDAGSGHLGLAVLEGEPGIGKTTLASYFAAECAQHGANVFMGRSSQERLVPYQPFVEALGQWPASGAPDLARVDLGPGAAALVHLVPGLAVHVGATDGHAPADPDSQRYWLFEAIVAVLLAAASTRPLLLVLDDLQWADESSLLLVQHLARRLGPVPAMIVATVRGGLQRRHPVRTAFAELHRVASPVWLTLGGLSPGEIAELASVPQELAEAIHRVTEGNPFFVEEVVEHLREHDALRVDAVGVLPIPRGVHQTIEARLADLPDDANRALAHAAVLGQEFDLPVLARMADRSEDEMVDALDDALLARLVAEDDAPDRFRFTHALVRQALIEGISVARLRRLHARAASAIEEVYRDELTAHLPAVARHYRAAGSVVPATRTLAFSIGAGMACQGALAYEDALEHWNEALLLVPDGADGDAQRGRLHELIGQLLFSTGIDRGRGILHLDEAVAIHERSDNASGAARLHCRLGQALASMPETMDIASALDHYRTARAMLESDPATPTASYLYTGLAAAALYSLDNAEGLEAATRGIESSRGHDSATAMAIALRGAHRAYLGEVDDGFAELEQAWALADATGAAVPAFLAAWMRGWGAMLLLDPADARTWCDRELGTRRMERMPRNRDTLRATRAISGLLQGMPGDDELDLEPGANVPLFEPLCAMRRGEWDDASEMLAAGVASVIQAGNRADEYLLTYWLGHLHRVRGDVDAARTVLEHLLASDEDHGALPPCHELVVRAELARLDDAHTQLPRCHEIMGTRDWHGLTGRVGLAHAVDAASRGRPDSEVDDAFRGAIDVFAAKGLRWDEADAALEWASAMDRAGRHTEAGRLRDAAAASYRSMGASQPWLDRIGAFA